MIKWPFKMWLWGKDGIFVASNRPPDPGDDLIAISVYPTDQAPEPVAVLNIGDGCGLALAPGAWLRVRNLPPGQHALYLAPPSTIRQEER